MDRVRVTVNIPEEANEWLEAEKDRLHRSKADLGGHLITVMYNSVEHINLQQDDVPYSDAQQSDVEKRLDELEARMDAVERATEETPTRERSATRADADDQTGAVEQERDSGRESGLRIDADDDAVQAALEACAKEWSRQNDDEKVQQMVAAGRAALELLRGGEELRTGEFQERLQGDYPVREQPTDTDTYTRKTVRPALQAAEERGLVEQQAGTWLWRWVDD